MAEVKFYRWSELAEQRPNRLLSRKFVVGANAMLALMDMKKGCVVPTHHHPEEQISYILKGVLKFSTGGREFVVRAGEVVYIPPNIEHSTIALEDCLDLDTFSPPRNDLLKGEFDKQLERR